MLILCDFDGTVTREDVTNLLWDRHGIPRWREKLLGGYLSGAMSTLELMDVGWRAINLPVEELLATARSGVVVRPGLERLLDTCRTHGWSFHVVSNGLDWYLREFLPRDVPFTSYVASLDADGWRVRLPAGYVLPSGMDFKVHVLAGLRAHARPGVETVFIGDGRNDFPVARACDRIFAVRGSTLASLCATADVPCGEFDSFDEVTEAMENIDKLEV